GWPATRSSKSEGVVPPDGIEPPTFGLQNLKLRVTAPNKTEHPIVFKALRCLALRHLLSYVINIG
ncbi:hypothetical protein, partial [Mesorhizobium sp. M0006]|uniref:hypothetical protein n=1 Tax=Mesorhizobium sp. M0006 TaxID=2956838 RepID=UPI003337EE4A